MCGTFVRENREGPSPPVRVVCGRAAWGTLRRYAQDARRRAVGSLRNTCDPAEQGLRAAEAGEERK